MKKKENYMRRAKIYGFDKGKFDTGKTGYFHQWSFDYDWNSEEGFFYFPAAILEQEDGSILVIAAEMIKFID